MLVANARMYAVTPQVRDAWRALFDWVSRYSGIPLVYVDHAAPAPLEDAVVASRSRRYIHVRLSLRVGHAEAADPGSASSIAAALPPPAGLLHRLRRSGGQQIPQRQRYLRRPHRLDGSSFAIRIQRRPASPVAVPARIRAIVHAEHRTAGDAAQGDRGGGRPRDRHWPARFVRPRPSGTSRTCHGGKASNRRVRRP